MPHASLSTPCRLAEAAPRAPRAAVRACGRQLRELQARLAAFGPETLDDRDALQLLCGLDEAGAAALLEAFGSLPEVFGAAAPDLARLGGARAAARLKLAQEVARRALRQPLRARAVISSSAALADYLRTTLTGAPREQFRVLFLDKRNRLIADLLMGEGTVDHAPVYPREVVRQALALHACGLILVHNHPSGDPSPSSADVQMTREVVDAARALRLAVHDHILVAGGQAVSFRVLGVFP